MTFSVHHIRVQAKAIAPLQLHVHTGAALRGAFFNALWERFCTNHAAKTCAECPLLQACPVSSLMAPHRDDSPRGNDIPRPFAIRPPLHHAGSFAPDEQFAWGLTLIGQSTKLFPYVAMALHMMGQNGLGKRVAANDWERGRFVVEQVDAVQLLHDQTQLIQAAGSQRIQTPNLPMTWADAEQIAQTLSNATIRLHFMTPLRIIEQKILLKVPQLRPIVQRLTERHDGLAREHGSEPFSYEQRQAFLGAAAAIKLVQNDTHWVDLDSYSARQRRKTPIGGLVGSAEYSGDLALLLPLLVWGSVIQVGKDTTKGNGVYRIS
ncbi:CRISPR system precrRNA processing endoribonuclease RAMP protein Cas6 [Herpetosiphon sp. NSE202]|uniref:CRISPR system precrRNA processing endoribonuclease RAMP protein Cas6 n=1 Tax=Herpetosiphon sp. NSE202 TaxID=3351349 RepID=UPI003644F5FB